MELDSNQTVDLELVEKVQQGDKQAAEDLVTKYTGLVRHIVTRYHTPFHDWEDLCQEGFIGLLSAAKRYRPEAFQVKFSSFAYLCIRRKIYSVLKASNNNKHKLLNKALSLSDYANDDQSRTLGDLVAFDEQGPEQVVIERSTTERLRELLSIHLSALECTVTMLVLDGYTYSEISMVLDLDLKTVDNARTRSWIKLRRLIDNYGSLLSPKIPTQVRKREDLSIWTWADIP
ncbi:MAG: sigma-70 family RNA polymerase sigma factor [Limnochordia bacterium]|jgi:RNA polymerase sporulation-specific sigma factor|nr:sigma-70 family RNA polymerase sigma factor [Limnochordia bacterium]MDD2628668.1 sigma-70 family RNA polymerase sigma factor [Limnochordia bacterium]MDD4516893.1 sigma-70 family RNA polymerase sigma factor [Limnochordia bacterium]